MGEKKTITFLEARVVDDHRKGTKEEESYKKGETVSLDQASADRWVKRGAAVYGTKSDARKAETENPPAASDGAGDSTGDGSSEDDDGEFDADEATEEELREFLTKRDGAAPAKNAKVETLRKRAKGE